MKLNKQVATTTMKDVALKAKVSTTTVSHILMNPDRISQSTRNKVEQTILEVGYLPQSAGRSVKHNESYTILMVVSDICDPFFSEMVRGIEVATAEQGCLVFTDDYVYRDQQEKTFLNLITTKQINDMVLLSSCLSFDANVEGQRNLPPMVMSGEFTSELGFPTIYTSNLTATFNTMDYLLGLGHEHVGCIAEPEDMSLCHYRLRGCVQASCRSRITVDPHLIVRGDFAYEAGVNALKQLLELSQSPTTVPCYSGVVTPGILSYAKRRGLKVPNDLSIIGFDNISLTKSYDPPLTTVAQPRFNVGCGAILLLLDQLQGQSVSSGSRLLDYELIIRGTIRALT